MYTTTSSYKNALKSGHIKSRVEITITPANGVAFTITDADILPGSLSINNRATSSGEFSYGAVYVGAMGVTLIDVNDEINRYSLFGAQVDVVFVQVLSANEEERIPMGTFFVNEPQRKKKTVVLNCYDAMTKFDVPLTEETFGTPYALLSYLCSLCGVQLGMTQEQVEAMPNGTAQFTLANYAQMSARDALGNIAKVLCGFATIDRSGKLVIRRFSTNHCDEIGAQSRVSSTIADYQTYFVGVMAEVTVEGEAVSITALTGNEDGLLLDLGSIQIARGTEITMKAVMQAIADELAEVEYTPATIEIISDPSFDLGDMVLLADVNNTTDNVSAVITAFDWKYHAKMKLTSDGRNALLNAVKSSELKTISAVQSSVRESAFNIKSYVNSQQFGIVDHDTTIITFTYSANKDTTAVFLATIPIEMSLDGDVVFTIYRGWDVWNTLTKYVPRGKSFVTISSYFPSVVNEVVTIKVTMRCEYFESDKRIQDSQIAGLIDAVETGEYVPAEIDTTIPGATIDVLSIRASIFASGLNVTDIWGGYLDMEDSIPVITIPAEQISVHDISDIPAVLVNSNGEAPTITEIISAIGIGQSSIGVSQIAEEIVVGRMVLYYTINTSRAGEYTYDSGKVAIINDEFVLNQTYPSVSTHDTIDRGVMKKCDCSVDGLTPSNISLVTSGEDEGDDYYMLISGFDGDEDSVYSIDDAELMALKVQLPHKQDLNGYSKPWLGGLGKNICPNILTTQVISGVTFTVYDDGSVLCTGKASALISKNITDDNHPLKLKAGANYFTSGCPQGGGGNSFQTRVCTTPTGTVGVADDTGSGNAFTVSAEGDYGFRLIVRNGYEFPSGGLLFKPMVEEVNIFRIWDLMASDITIANGEASGLSSKFHTAFKSESGGIPNLSFDEGVQYTISADIYTDGEQGTDGTGIVINFLYTDGTAGPSSSSERIQVPNSTSSYTSFTATSNASKSVSLVYISYSSKGSNTWHIKNVKIQKVTPAASPYEPYANECPIEGYTSFVGRKDYEEQWAPHTVNYNLTNGVNLFDRTGETTGKYLNKSGSITSNSLWSYSDFISVDWRKNYIFSDGRAGAGSTPSHWYFDANYNYIGNVVAKTNTRFTPPTNCAYMKFSYRSACTNPVLMENSGIAYDGYCDMVSGNLHVGCAILDLGNCEWVQQGSYTNIFRTSLLSDTKPPASADERNKSIACTCFPATRDGHVSVNNSSGGMDDNSILRNSTYLYVKCGAYDGDVEGFAAAMKGQYAIYPCDVYPDIHVTGSGSTGMDLEPGVVNTYTNSLNNDMIGWNGGMRVEGTEISIDANVPVIKWREYLEDMEGDTFEYDGFTDVSLLEDAKASIFSLGNFSIMRWTDDDSETGSSMIVTITGVPTPQDILTPAFSFIQFNVSGIELTNTDTSGNPQVALKFDSGPWEYYDTTDQQWQTVGQGSRGYMTVADLEDITEQMWAAKLNGVSTMQTRFTLTGAGDAVAEIQYKFLNE